MRSAEGFRQPPAATTITASPGFQSASAAATAGGAGIRRVIDQHHARTGKAHRLHGVQQRRRILAQVGADRRVRRISSSAPGPTKPDRLGAFQRHAHRVLAIDQQRGRVGSGAPDNGPISAPFRIIAGWRDHGQKPRHHLIGQHPRQPVMRILFGAMVAMVVPVVEYEVKVLSARA